MNIRSVAVMAVVAVVVVASLAVALVYLNGGSSEQTAGDSEFYVIDDRGKNITFEKAPKRIVSLGSSFTETIIALNAGNMIVGVDASGENIAGVPENASRLGKVSAMGMESLLAVDPDCVIIWNFPSYGGLISDMENYSIPVVALYPKSVSDTLDTMARIGSIIGSDATELVDQLQARVNAVLNVTKNIPEWSRPKVYLELSTYGMSTVGNGSLSNEIIQLAGGLNIYDKVKVNNKSNWVASIEDVLDRQPEFIIVENSSAHTNQYFIETFAATPAVDYGNVYRIEAGTLTTSPRIVEALECMAHWFHPDLFA